MSSARDCAQVIEYWDLVPAIVGGVIGALAGGVPAWILAKRQSDETLKRDREERRSKERSLAFAVIVKTQLITNSALGLYNHIIGRLELRSIEGYGHMEPWQVLTPMIGHTNEEDAQFTPEELGVFAAAGEYDLMQELMLLAVRHATSLVSFKQYCEMRRSFQEIGPKPAEFRGQVGSAFLSKEEVIAFKPYTIPLNDLALGLERGIKEDIRLARSVSEKIGPVVKRYFEDEGFASLSFPSDDEITAMRQDT